MCEGVDLQWKGKGVKFSCPKCSMEYKINRDRLRDRLLKVRCKNCQSVFYIRSENDGESGVVLLDDPYKDDDPREEVWYYLQNDDAIGPVSLEHLSASVEAQLFTPETWVWRQGMAQWTPAEEIVTLNRMFVAMIDGDAQRTIEVGTGIVTDTVDFASTGKVFVGGDLEIDTTSVATPDDPSRQPRHLSDTLKHYDYNDEPAIEEINGDDDRYVLGTIAVKKKLFNRKLSESGNTEILESVDGENSSKKDTSSNTLYMFPISNELRDAELRRSASISASSNMNDTVEMDLSRTRETPTIGSYSTIEETAYVNRSHGTQAMLRTLFWVLIFIAVSLLTWLLVNRQEDISLSLYENMHNPIQVSEIHFPPSQENVFWSGGN